MQPQPKTCASTVCTLGFRVTAPARARPQQGQFRVLREVKNKKRLSQKDMEQLIDFGLYTRKVQGLKFQIVVDWRTKITPDQWKIINQYGAKVIRMNLPQ